jgi:hypothetical protein
MPALSKAWRQESTTDPSEAYIDRVNGLSRSLEAGTMEAWALIMALASELILSDDMDWDRMGMFMVMLLV